MHFNDDHDHETPDCPLCNEKVGLHNDAMMLLPGQFFYHKEDSYSMFVLDPDIKIGFLEIPNALGPGQSQFAIIINHDDPAPAAVVHAPCLEDELVSLDEEDEEEEDPDDLDEQMMDAIARDPDPDDINWDAHDIPYHTRR